MIDFAASFGRSGGAWMLLFALVSCDESSPTPPVEQRADVRDRRVDAGRPLAPLDDDDAQNVELDSGVPRQDAAPATLVPPPDKASAPADSGALAQALPCGVAELLRARCGECHGTVPQSGAPMSLTTWPQLHAAARDAPGEQVYQQIAKRVRDDVHPMPPAPSPRLSEAELQTLDEWFAQGAPPSSSEQTCEPAAPPSEQPPSSDEPPSDCVDFYELRAHGKAGASDDSPYIVGADVDNQFTCFYFSPPYAEGDQGLWFEPLVDNPQVVHHWLLYALDLGERASGSLEPCSIDSNPGKSMIAGWAPGGRAPSYPKDVGMELPSKGLFVELHYYNPTGQAQADRSGVRMCTAPKGARPHTAAMHFTGTDGICLQPGAESEVSGLCDPPDTEDIHLINVFPHMHKLGRHMSMTILRKDGSRETLHDGSFDFNAQLFFPVDAVLHPGDRIETRCRYENTTSEQVKWGERTQDEMCYGFVTAWPAGALSVDPSMLDLLSGVALAVQPANRCLNPVSFVDSCNGVLDLPQLQ